MKEIIYFLMVWVILSSSGCNRKIIPLNDGLRESAILSYLACTECTKDDLEQILILKEDAIPFLKDVVIYGAPPLVQSLAYYKYESINKKLEGWGEINGIKFPLKSPESEVAKLNFRYQSKATYALMQLGLQSEIGIPPVIRVLQELKNLISNLQLIATINQAIDFLRSKQNVANPVGSSPNFQFEPNNNE